MSDYTYEPPEHLGRALTKHLVTGILTAVVVAGGLGVLYILAPVPDEPWSVIHFTLFAFVCAIVFLGVTVGAVLRLSRTSRPLITGLIFVVIMATILVLSYSWLYLSMSNVNPAVFTEQLTKASAVYFTVTILSTVGFGDITPVGDVPRLVVTSQMVIGFAVLTVAIKTITTTTTNVIKRKHSKQTTDAKAEEFARWKQDVDARLASKQPVGQAAADGQPTAAEQKTDADGPKQSGDSA